MVRKLFLNGGEESLISTRQEALEDFSLRPVPADKRKSWVDITMVWVGVAVVLSAMLRGMMVGSGLGSPGRVLLAYGLGELILIFLMSLTGYLGAKTGLSTPLLAARTFGPHGSGIISLLLGIAFLGWFAVQSGLFAEAIMSYSPLPLPKAFISLGAGLLMMLPAVVGFRGLKALSWVAVPPMLAVFFYAAAKVGTHFLPREELMALVQARQPALYQLSLGEAASLVAGGFIVGAVTAADIFRYARPRWREIALAASIAMVVSALMQLVGSVLALSTGLTHDQLPRVLISPEFAGLGFFGFLAIALAQWTTNDSNLYSSVLAFNKLLPFRRWKLAVGLGVFASVLAAAGILTRLSLFLSILAVACGPVGGILVVDHYFVPRQRSLPEMASSRKKMNFNWLALTAYFLATLVGWLTSGHPWSLRVFPFSIFAFNGILAGGIFYGLGWLFLGSRKRAWGQ